MGNPETSVVAIEERLKRVEEENRRLKCRSRLTQGGLAFLTVVVLMLGAAKGPDGSFGVLTVERLVVRDKNGTQRVLIKTSDEGTAEQSFYDKNGTQRVLIKTSFEGSAGQSFYDKNGTQRVLIMTDSQGTSMQTFYDKGGKERVGIIILPDGTAAQQFQDSNGKVQMFLPQ